MATIVECRSEVQGSEASVSNVEEEIAHQQESTPVGYIYHSTSLKAIHPNEGLTSPTDNTRLVTHDGTGEFRLQFQFIPEPRYGHYGYIKHLGSASCWW